MSLWSMLMSVAVTCMPVMLVGFIIGAAGGFASGRVAEVTYRSAQVLIFGGYIVAGVSLVAAMVVGR